MADARDVASKEIVFTERYSEYNPLAIVQVNEKDYDIYVNLKKVAVDASTHDVDYDKGTVTPKATKQATK